MRSRLRLEPAAWAKSIARRTRGSIASSPSKSCVPTLRATSSRVSGSSMKRALSPGSTIHTFACCTTSAANSSEPDADEFDFLVMELVEGETLGQVCGPGASTGSAGRAPWFGNRGGARRGTRPRRRAWRSEAGQHHGHEVWTEASGLRARAAAFSVASVSDLSCAPTEPGSGMVAGRCRIWRRRCFAARHATPAAICGHWASSCTRWRPGSGRLPARQRSIECGDPQPASGDGPSLGAARATDNHPALSREGSARSLSARQ